MEFTILLAYLLCYYAILFLSENILPQNGRKSRLSGTKRRVFSQFGFLSQRGRALNRLWVAINLRLTNEKQLGANKFIVTKLKDWISSINKHYARPDLLVRGGNTINRKKEKAFTWNKTFKTFFSTDHLLWPTHRDLDVVFPTRASYSARQISLR